MYSRKCWKELVRLSILTLMTVFGIRGAQAQYWVHKAGNLENYASLSSALAVVNASSTGGTVYLPRGIITISDPIALKGGVELVGVGSGGSNSSQGGSTLLIDNATDDVIRIEGDIVSIRNVTLRRDEETSVTATTGGAVNLNGHDAILLYGVNCENHNFGVYVRDPADDVNEDSGDPPSTSITIEESVFTQMRTAAVFGDESSTTTQGRINGLFIKKCLFRYSYGEAIHYYNSDPTNPNYFSSSLVTGTRGTGVSVAANNSFFDHFFINTTGGPCIEMFNMKRGSISHCNIFGSGACIAEPTSSETWELGEFVIEPAAARARALEFSPPGVSLGLSFSALLEEEVEFGDALGTLDDIQVVDNMINWNAGYGILLIGKDDDEQTTSVQNIRIHGNSVHTNGRGSIEDCNGNADPTSESSAIYVIGRIFGALSKISHLSILGNRCYNDPTLIGDDSFFVPWPQDIGLTLVGEMDHLRVRDNDFVDPLHSTNLDDISSGSPNVISDNFD